LVDFLGIGSAKLRSTDVDLFVAISESDMDIPFLWRRSFASPPKIVGHRFASGGSVVVLTEAARESKLNCVKYGALAGAVSAIDDSEALRKIDAYAFTIAAEPT